jgi:triphosphoribosyl-dephospho-CoA synthase
VSGLAPDQIAAAFIASCRDELDAPKPGNVHTFSSGHDMEARHFIASARVSAPAIASPGARVGSRIRNAVDKTFAEVGMNTNLGILLLCAPLARAAEVMESDLRLALADVLQNLDLQDAADVYAAIKRASPGGLGHASRYDVHEPPPSSLIEAMREAAERDMIARQYVTDFADVFGMGLVAATEIKSRGFGHSIPLGIYLAFLSQFLDTHVVRKHGADVAEAVMREARVLAERMRSAGIASAFLADLLAFDARLKADRINPGTSADLTVATLFAARLSGVLPMSPGDG